MAEGLFCSFFTEEPMDMKNNITAQIESGYGDLRKSEKQAADYILDHMEEAAELPLNLLAEAADVAVGISYSGESRDTVDALKAAKQAGACTIAVTNFNGSTICRYADILICTSQDQHFYGNAIFSRATQILIVDMIYMGLISSDYEHYVNQLNKCENVVRRKAYENN